jgi:SRSO17 transposase
MSHRLCRTDYVASQYIGNVGQVTRGIVSVNAYGMQENTPFPLAFLVYKPQRRLKPGDVYKSKPQLAIDLIEDLQARGFRFDVVLADCLYGESDAFTATLERLGLHYVVALRSYQRIWMGPGERKRYPRWRTFDRVFADGTSAPRFIREVIFGTRARHRCRYYQITTDKERQPQATTWLVATNLPGKIERTVGDTYGWRTWIEDGFKQSKDELGWADYRVTDYAAIERWWEIVMSAALLVSLQRPALASRLPVASGGTDASVEAAAAAPLSAHPQWDGGPGWKRTLNNLRLIVQPYVCACLLLPWRHLVPLPHLQEGLADLCRLMNTFRPLFPT